MKGKRTLEHWQKIAIILIIYDIIMVNLSYGMTLWLRFDLHYMAIPEQYKMAWLHMVPIYTVFCLIVFWYLRLYKSVWRFASYSELLRVGMSSLITAVFHAAVITLLFRRMPLTYYIFGTMLQFLAVLGIRFSYRLMLLAKKKAKSQKGDRIMLIGAGSHLTQISS